MGRKNKSRRRPLKKASSVIKPIAKQSASVQLLDDTEDFDMDMNFTAPEIKPTKPVITEAEITQDTTLDPSTFVTIRVSWRYEGHPPKVDRIQATRYISEGLPDHCSVANIRLFSHKLFADIIGADQLPRPYLQQVRRSFQELYPAVTFFAKEDKPSDEDARTVFLGRILGADEANLLELAAEVGVEAQQARVARNSDGESRNFGYLVFSSVEDAEKAAGLMNGRSVGLSTAVRTDLLVRDGKQRKGSGVRRVNDDESHIVFN
eukprot:gnl/Dysnectes_brevis/367_a409_3443.p1 GENE.gnl/Dysnectes_brevis/367_a409_3443~~gnl/Dysnectes_brevis/367_a409_3443.p1  ORF type:complete len:263 (+),score=67.11 gnl/Dysnectes_brevis/367_a409_3443:154-942(+)